MERGVAIGFVRRLKEIRNGRVAWEEQRSTVHCSPSSSLKRLGLTILEPLYLCTLENLSVIALNSSCSHL